MKNKFRIGPRDEVVERLENYLVVNKFPPHHKIPSERDLCELWEVNRSTLRSAIQRLVAEGKLYSKEGSGTFVAKPKLIRNLQDLKSFTQVANEAGLLISSQQLSLRVIECNKQILTQLHVSLGSKIYELIRLRFIDGVPLNIETTYIAYELCPGLENHDFNKVSLYSVLEDTYKIDINRGHEKLGITYITEDEAELLDMNEGDHVFYVSGVTESLNGVPIEYYKSLFRADKIRFASALTR
ncbi:GntR family transcriptional regulator [Neobacillus bataviensis LMG 21833]|uniref:GntR family transcriptional regulator n=1 Tax=Neobacillus bataviensis LMG 21833 TaxID=1117379 RepID=K6DBN6_9BACI|nr:GntR family transcriptional regulator [Neobacillus bataviensis]EKN69957.1 GntR family transcriptional regulator [Neobacillus bataviensis LMG 21833]